MNKFLIFCLSGLLLVGCGSESSSSSTTTTTDEETSSTTSGTADTTTESSEEDSGDAGTCLTSSSMFDDVDCVQSNLDDILDYTVELMIEVSLWDAVSYSESSGNCLVSGTYDVQYADEDELAESGMLSATYIVYDNCELSEGVVVDGYLNSFVSQEDIEGSVLEGIVSEVDEFYQSESDYDYTITVDDEVKLSTDSTYVTATYTVYDGTQDYVQHDWLEFSGVDAYPEYGFEITSHSDGLIYSYETFIDGEDTSYPNVSGEQTLTDSADNELDVVFVDNVATASLNGGGSFIIDLDYD